MRHLIIIGAFLAVSAVSQTVTEYDHAKVVDGVLIGGLSGVEYESSTDSFWVIVDDRGDTGGARLVNFSLDDQHKPHWLSVVFLRDEAGNLLNQGDFDGEGLAIGDEGFWISSEPIAGIDSPLLQRFDRSGVRIETIGTPDHVFDLGLRDNKGLEALTSYSGLLIAGLEDFPVNSETHSTYIFCVNPTTHHWASLRYDLDDFDRSSGDTGLVAIYYSSSQESLMSVERSYQPGIGNTIKLFKLTLDCSVNNSKVHKSNRINLAGQIEESPDNVEGATEDALGRLLLVSDNNFNPKQKTQIIVINALTGNDFQ